MKYFEMDSCIKYIYRPDSGGSLFLFGVLWFWIENVKSTGTRAEAEKAYFKFSFEIKVSFSTFTKGN